jgi:hypothetical protein
MKSISHGNRSPENSLREIIVFVSSYIFSAAGLTMTQILENIDKIKESDLIEISEDNTGVKEGTDLFGEKSRKNSQINDPKNGRKNVITRKNSVNVNNGEVSGEFKLGDEEAQREVLEYMYYYLQCHRKSAVDLLLSGDNDGLRISGDIGSSSDSCYNGNDENRNNDDNYVDINNIDDNIDNNSSNSINNNDNNDSDEDRSKNNKNIKKSNSTNNNYKSNNNNDNNNDNKKDDNLVGNNNNNLNNRNNKKNVNLENSVIWFAALDTVTDKDPAVLYRILMSPYVQR